MLLGLLSAGLEKRRQKTIPRMITPTAGEADDGCGCDKQLLHQPANVLSFQFDRTFDDAHFTFIG